MNAWTFDRLWPRIRDVASWGLGAWWGNGLMVDPAPADPLKVMIVVGLLGLPFAARADELWRRWVERQQPQHGSPSNGTTPQQGEHAEL